MVVTDPFDMTVFWKVTGQENVNVDSVTFRFSTVITWFRCSNYTDQLHHKNTDQPWQQAGHKPDSQHLSEYCLFFCSQMSSVILITVCMHWYAQIRKGQKNHWVLSPEIWAWIAGHKVFLRELIYFYSIERKQLLITKQIM